MQLHARRIISLSVFVIAPVSAHAQQQTGSSFVAPAWAYPAPSTPATPADSVKLHRVPGSSRAFTELQTLNRYDVVDWFPGSHPAAPAPVIKGQKARVAACGYCHLPDGSGRPENARLAGLNAEYIVQQVLDMKSGARNGAGPANFPPSVNMRAVADSVSLEDLRAAARYFSQLKPHRRSRVVETTKIPRVEPLLGVYAKSETRDSEPLGHRLIEAAQDAKRHELRDPRTAYVAYVPPGSIKAGQRLATQGRADGLKSCVSCHGPQLRGVGPVPRIAGQPPSYILRQLVAFKVGSRATEQGELMQDVASRLSLDDMIAVAAYAGSRLP